MEYVISRCYGGFGLSNAAMQSLHASNPELVEYEIENGVVYYSFTDFDALNVRSHPALIAIVKTMGPAANGQHAELAIVEVPNDAIVCIQNYDGAEWIAEVHRTWR